MLKAIVFLLAFAGCSFAAQNKNERAAETAQAASEEEEARKSNPETVYAEYSGKLALLTKEQKEASDESGIVGTFSTEKTIYFIKLESEKTLDALKQFDGKPCTVSAKIRNEGKYIIVRKVVLAGAEYIYQKRRGGVGM